MSKERSPEFALRLGRIKALERELHDKAALLMAPGSPLFLSDLFVIGGIKRALAVASGFRVLMGDRNFTCAAALLRMQIDTAARIFALSYVPDLQEFGRRMVAGERFDKEKDEKGNRLRDSHIIAQLGRVYPWVKKVYEETSGFVHLSPRHLFASVVSLNDEERTVRVQISAEDPLRADQDYHEVLDAFAEATNVAGIVIMGYLVARQNGFIQPEKSRRSE